MKRVLYKHKKALVPAKLGLFLCCFLTLKIVSKKFKISKKMLVLCASA